MIMTIAYDTGFSHGFWSPDGVINYKPGMRKIGGASRADYDLGFSHGYSVGISDQSTRARLGGLLLVELRYCVTDF
jgi:hypothetical protein